MKRQSPFEEYADRYDAWFEKNQRVYDAELSAVKRMIPVGGRGLEVGLGTGRFAEPLGIREGVEPSNRMGEIAQRRGIQVVRGVAEALPFDNSRFDFALMVTTLCFVEDVRKALLEAHRVLREGGAIVIGFIDRNSRMGKSYLDRQQNNVFYKDAIFFSVDELVTYMEETGFTDLVFAQTVFGTLQETRKDEPVKHGYGEGSFVVMCGKKRAPE